jgi:hypothetical protein
VARFRSAFVQEPLFDVTVRPERRYYKQMLDALARSGFGADPFEAELVVSKLFGTVWSAQPSMEEAFGLGLVEYTARHPGPVGAALLGTLAAVAPVREVRVAAAGIFGGPLWTIVPGSCWAYEDAYGDQTTVVVSFSGPVPHALLIRVDQLARGAAVDASLALDVDSTVAELRHLATASDRLFVLRPIDQPWARSLLARAIARSDLVPVSPRFAELRALALARLAVLADGPDPLEPVSPPAAVLVAEFLASAEAAGLPSEAAAVAARVAEFASRYDPADAARVSPARWQAFFDAGGLSAAGSALESASGSASSEVAPVLRAWSRWAGRRMALPETARVELAAALEDLLAGP